MCSSHLLGRHRFRRATYGRHLHHLHIVFVVCVASALISSVIQVRRQPAVHAKIVDRQGRQEGETLHILAVQISLYSLQLKETHDGSWVYRKEGQTDREKDKQHENKREKDKQKTKL